MEKLKQIPNRENVQLENETEPLYHELIEKPEIVEALTLLDRLPKHLRYHDKAHTLDVIRETILFAFADRVSRDIIEQQAISAAWHDVGFIEQDKENEPIAVKLFEQSKAYQTLPDEKRKEIIANIFDTTPILKGGQPFLLKQQSTFGYMLDGDMSNFGRKDFFEKRMKVVEEMGLDITNSDIKKRFYKSVMELLKNHDWKTDSARSLRQAQKEENVRQVEEEYALCAAES